MYSDRLVSGNITIKGKNEKVVWNIKFNQKGFINVKVQSSWTKHLMVVIKSESTEIKKTFTL